MFSEYCHESKSVPFPFICASSGPAGVHGKSVFFRPLTLSAPRAKVFDPLIGQFGPGSKKFLLFTRNGFGEITNFR
jgi:hypothetical protein